MPVEDVAILDGTWRAASPKPASSGQEPRDTPARADVGAVVAGVPALTCRRELARGQGCFGGGAVQLPMEVGLLDLSDGAVHEPVDQGPDQPGDARQRSSLPKLRVRLPRTGQLGVLLG